MSERFINSAPNYFPTPFKAIFSHIKIKKIYQYALNYITSPTAIRFSIYRCLTSEVITTPLTFPIPPQSFTTYTLTCQTTPAFLMRWERSQTASTECKNTHALAEITGDIWSRLVSRVYDELAQVGWERQYKKKGTSFPNSWARVCVCVWTQWRYSLAGISVQECHLTTTNALNNVLRPPRRHNDLLLFRSSFIWK